MSSVMNAVYNNYLTTYTPKSLTRYDTHKKSELRGVYNSIVKMNKESPWYLPTTSRDTQHYAVDLKENARALHNTIAQIGGLDESEALQKKSAFSSNPDVVTATFIGDSLPSGAPEGFEIEVQSLATSQENMGLFLPEGAVALKPDTYSFDISINDMNYEFQFSIGEGETNREVQERLARLINNSSIGIRAAVLEEDHRTSLNLTSESTGLANGKNQIFSVSDERTSKEKGTVQYFGLDYTSREASNASFKINGEDRTASSNHFTVAKLYELELKGVSPEDTPTTIGLKTDVESMTDNVRQLVSGYNDFIRAASSYLDSQSRSRALLREMRGIAGSYSQEFESMGLNLTPEGTISVDSDLLRQAAQRAQDTGGTFDPMRGFTQSLLRKSEQVSLNPMDYVEKTVVAYKNPGHNFVSPYTTSNYSGMMFNFYC